MNGSGLAHSILRYASKILDAKYEKVKVEDIVAAQSHLTPNQRDDLAKLLKNMKNSSVENLDCIHTKK